MARREFGLHKVGRYWHCDFKAGTEHIHRSTRATIYDPDALDVARQWHSEALRRSKGLPVNTEATVKDLWIAWWAGTKQTLSESHRDRVERDWRLHILPALGDRMAKTITTADAEALRAAFLSGKSLKNAHQEEAKKRRLQAEAKASGTRPENPPKARPRTLAGSNKLLLHFHLVFAWAVEVPKTLAEVPWGVKILESQEKPKPTLTRETVRAFLAVVDKASLGRRGAAGGHPSQNPLHVQVAVRAMVYCALREKEALRLRWEWFSRDLSTFQHGERKAKDAPAFPVPADFRAKLAALIPAGQSRPTAGLVIPAADALPHRAQFTRKAIEAAAADLGIHLTPHSMRHSWATMTARATGNAHLIKDGLGQKSLNQAMAYVKLNTEDLAAGQAAVFGSLATGEIQSQPGHKLVKKFILKIRKQMN